MIESKIWGWGGEGGWLGWGGVGGAAGGAGVGIEATLSGAVAGAAMNPARAFGPYVAMGDFSHYWIYLVGPFAGMALGGFAYRFTHALGGRAV